MCNLFKLISLSLIIVLCFGATYDSSAQVKSKRHSKHSLRDSLREKVLQRDSELRSFKHSDGSVNNLLGKIEDYASSYNQISNDLSKGFDTLDISQRLPQLERRMVLMRTTIDKSTTLGYLTTIRDMIDHVSEQMSTWEDQLVANNDDLDKMREKVAAFKEDTVLHTVPADSSLRAKCFLQVQDLEAKMHKLDSCTKKSAIKVGLLENRVSALSILLIDLDDRIDLRIHEFTLKALTNEYGFIWSGHNYERADTALSRSYNLNLRLYRYFLTSKSNFWPHVGCLVLLVLFFIWIISSKRKISRVKLDHQHVFSETRYIVKHPYITSLAVVSIIGAYFYDHPPQVFAQTTLLIMMGCIGVLIKNNWPKPLFNFWKVIFIATIFFSVSNLMILITFADRFLLLVLAGICIYASFKLAKTVKKTPEVYPPHLEIALKIFVAVQAISIILNLAGRFSLAKIAGTMAAFNLCLGMGLYLFVQILMEGLFLQLEANKSADNQSIASYLDFKIAQKKFRDVVIKVAAVLWLIALAQNLNIDDYLYDQASNFLSDQHKLAGSSSTAFTFGSVLIFIIVIWLSGLLARVISYFYDFASQQQTKLSPKDKKTRSSILLIRLTIFVIGFFVAITAAGIPMDRVTIIIGALGVGIGFGLQNIVNNLVSGVILAFEKPIQVGDIIEVAGKTGTIKEIGIRSSKISRGDGSELIVPNGDLISQHVVNWTLSDNNRQVELIVGIAYGTDVAKVEILLKNILDNQGDIMKSPAPVVLLHNFSDSSVDFRLLFWAADIGTWARLKSNVMSEIYTRFTKEGIEIPHPKRDIQIYFPESTIPEDIDKLKKATKNPPAKDQ